MNIASLRKSQVSAYNTKMKLEQIVTEHLKSVEAIKVDLDNPIEEEMEIEDFEYTFEHALKKEKLTIKLHFFSDPKSPKFNYTITCHDIIIRDHKPRKNGIERVRIIYDEEYDLYDKLSDRLIEKGKEMEIREHTKIILLA